MPKPYEHENKKDYIKRCIPMLIKDEGKPQKQAVAACMNMFDHYMKKQDFVPVNETVEILNEATTLQKVVHYGKIAKAAILQDPISIVSALSSKLPKDKTEIEPDESGFIISKIKKPSPTKLMKFDDRSTHNKIPTRPQGIIICDTVNNPIFPIDKPFLDSAKFDLPDIKLKFKSYYVGMDFDFLPWHYVVEIINGKYYFFQTRPIDMRFPINNIEFLDLLETNRQYLKINKTTETFIKHQPFDICDAIHVCIIGDTNLDVYIERLYEMIGRICAGPILRYFKLPSSINLRVINFNLGNKFIFEKLENYLKR